MIPHYLLVLQFDNHSNNFQITFAQHSLLWVLKCFLMFLSREFLSREDFYYLSHAPKLKQLANDYGGPVNCRLTFKGTNGSETLFLCRQQQIQLMTCYRQHGKSYIKHDIKFMALNSRLVGKNKQKAIKPTFFSSSDWLCASEEHTSPWSRQKGDDNLQLMHPGTPAQYWLAQV